jgi:hypothetical protein
LALTRLAAPGRSSATNQADTTTSPSELTDREIIAGSMLWMLAASENGWNEELAKKDQQKIAEVEIALDKHYKQAWAENQNSSPEFRHELAVTEKLVRESYHLLDFLHRPTTFPTTRDSELDLERRANQIPRVLDRAETLDRDLKYHNRRLEILGEIEELKGSGARSRKLTGNERQQLEADIHLLAAVDAEYAAQVKADQIKLKSTTAPW